MELKQLWKNAETENFIGLLIVPYGIETKISRKKKRSLTSLLIVPYGIETGKRKKTLFLFCTFNCTLWN